MVRVPFLDLKAAHRELRPALDSALASVLDACQFICGPELERFEQAFASYAGAKYCVGVGNGLDALVLSLRSLDIGAGDEVIVPSHTFIATWLAVAAVGATPIPVEPPPGPGLFNITAETIAARITPRTKAIVPVHLYGIPAEIEAINALASRHGLAVIEDAAQAHGASVDGKRIGSHGSIACWSFYPGKNLGACGDAGAVTTDSLETAARLRKLRNYGSEKKYFHDLLGVNSRLDELQAALLFEKLQVLDAWNERRCRLAERYLAEIRNPRIELPRIAPRLAPVWHLFVVCTKRRDELKAYLAEREIDTLIHYPVAVHRSAAFAPGFRDVKLPVAERIADEVLSLPMGPHITDEQAAWVIDAVNRWQ